VPGQGQGTAGRGNSQGGAARQPGNGGTGGFGGVGGGQALTIAGANWDVLDPQLVQYLVANKGTARFLVATTTSTYASVFELATDQPAMALGGYQGWDRILTSAQLADLVRQGTVRFFLLNGSGSRNSFGAGFNGLADSQDATGDLTSWVQTTCTAVPSTQWQGTATGTGGATGTQARQTGGVQSQQLYDCANVAATKP
jgi:hypothetical protein